MDLNQFRYVLREECGLDFERPLVVGVSGGPDSLYLLDLLDAVQYPVIVAHFDHNLRMESADEAATVREEAGRRGLPFMHGSGDIRETARVEGLSIEEAARQARYCFLFAQARAAGAGAVAVAHHADDQVETVLMHLLRGSGLSGLKGMTPRAILPVWDAEIPLVRPLLAVWRAEILEYCAAHSLHPVLDASNQDTRYFRNRLRHELIPTLESYNPQFRQGILRMSRTLADDEELLREVIAERWPSCVLRAGEGYVLLDRARLRGFSRGMRKNMLREAVRRLRPALRDIDYAAISRAEELIVSESTTGQVDLTGGLALGLEGEAVVVAEDLAGWVNPRWPRMAAEMVAALPVPGRVSLEDSWQLSASFHRLDEAGRGMLSSTGPFEAWLDAERLEGALSVRTRHPGDRFFPLGMEGHSMKLSDFWINEGVPRRAREHWPLVFCGGDLVWVAGCRLADPYRVTQTTRQVLRLRLEQTG